MLRKEVAMRFVIAMMKHETNTFSPVPTPPERFGARGPLYGKEAFNAFRGTETPMAAFIDIALAENAQIVTPVAAGALPSGPVHRDAYQRMSDAICEEVRKGCDALFLDLHGAMVSEQTDDGEGALLERVRAVASGLPIAVALDLHTNLTRKMVENCTVLAGYKTYPHVDMYDSGALAGKVLVRAMKGEINPVASWGNRPMLPHTLRMGTHEPPMRNLVEMAKAAEKAGALAVSVFGGFPLADIHDAGLSAVVYTDGDRDRAEALCQELLEEAWKRRSAFVYASEPLSESVARAKQLSEGPILLIDHADNCASGGTQDTMAVLGEVMRQELEDVAVFAIRDPDAVAKLIEAGVGARVTVKLGGKMDLPSIGRKGEPQEVDGVVRTITDGEFTIRGPMLKGVRTFMGRTAVLDTGKVQIVVIERHQEPFDLGFFRSVGIEPTDKRYLLLKSRIHYRAAFAPLARHIIECNGVGVTSSDYSQFKFTNLRRPIYPLDQGATP
jgi:microcystin degradation protein MlrC